MTKILVLGASGYIGSHLVPRLVAAGHQVRAASRHREVLEGRGWAGVEIVEADALWEPSLDAALDGVEVAYYLVHSMASGRDYAERDRRAAELLAPQGACCATCRRPTSAGRPGLI